MTSTGTPARQPWKSDGGAYAREVEASHHAQRRTENFVSNNVSETAAVGGGTRSTAVRFALEDSAASAASAASSGGDESEPTADASMSGRDRPRPFAWEDDFEPPQHKDPLISRVASGQMAGRSPPLSRGPGPSAFTPSLWMTPAPARSSSVGRLGLGSLGYPTPSSSRLDSTMPRAGSPTFSRLEPRRNPLS